MADKEDSINIWSRKFPEEYLERLNMEPIARYKKYSNLISNM